MEQNVHTYRVRAGKMKIRKASKSNEIIFGISFRVVVLRVHDQGRAIVWILPSYRGFVLHAAHPCPP